MTETDALLDLEAILAPIPGDNPAGRNLRYEDVYVELRRDRRAVQDLSQPRTAETDTEYFDDSGAGAEELQRGLERKITGLLTAQSKDLQLAVWLVDLQATRNGFAGAAIGIQFIRELMRRYWDTLHPLPDPDDADPLEGRVGAIEWLGSKEGLVQTLQAIPLSDNGTDCSLYAYQYIEENARNSPEKDKKDKSGDIKNRVKEARDAFERAMQAGSFEYQQVLASQLDACGRELSLLEAFTNDHLQARRKRADGTERVEYLVSYKDLQDVLKECTRLVNRVLKPKLQEREAAARAAKAAAEENAEESADAGDAAPVGESTSPEAVDSPRPARRGAAAPVTTRDEALARLQTAADYLLTESTADPMPYLVDRAIAFSALFADAGLDASMPLPSPPTTVRARLKALATEAQSEELLRTAEAFLRSAPKQVWLDLQRYVITSLEQLGGTHAQTAAALTPPLRALLALMPGLVDAEFEDGTPVANHETHRWLREAGMIDAPPVLTVVRPVQTTSSDPGPASGEPSPSARPSVVDEAHALIKERRFGDALALLQSHVSAASSGRERFLRRLDLADVCLDAGNAVLAFPVLDDLAGIIERGRIEEWEEKAVVVRVWHSLVRCCRQLGAQPDVQAREKEIFDRLCRLDPAKALSLDKDAAASASRWHKR
jgi:type VI secretion system protein ImpA